MKASAIAVVLATTAALPLAAIAFAGPAVAEPLADPQRFWAAQLQQQRQERIERAQERCVEQRGVDCDTPEGLQEWLLLDRSRAEAVLDRVMPPPIVAIPPSVSASAGGSTPPPQAGGIQNR